MNWKRTAALAACMTLAIGGVTGCGGKKSDDPSKAPADKVGIDSDLKKYQNINEKPVGDLEDGGTLQLSVGGLGPNFNKYTNAGNSSDTSNVWWPMHQAGCFVFSVDGGYEPNKDFCLDAKEEIKDKKQTITLTLNPKAKFNDGTALDVKAVENTWKIMKDPKNDIVNTVGWADIESITQGKDAFEAVIKMKNVYEPWKDLFAGGTFISPKTTGGDFFTKGFVGNVHNELMSGPFKVEKYDNAAQQLVLVPNEKWHGNKPKLGKLIFKAMEASAEIAAYKNGELDVVGAGTAPRFNQVKGDANSDIRRGLRLGIFGFLFNSRNGGVADKAVRKAIWQAVDYKQLRDIRYKGIDWQDPSSGSWLLSPISKFYSDNRPIKERDLEGAKKTLADAGYTAGANGKLAKAGKPLVVKVVNFGDDQTGTAIVQAFQKAVSESGIDIQIDQKPSSAFNDIMDKQAFEIASMGYTIGSDAASGAKQFFSSKEKSNMTGVGTPEIDEALKTITQIVDDKERNAKANEIEKQFMEQFVMMPVFTPPTIGAYRKGLANYGPNLFKGAYTPDWTIVGWEKGSKHK